MNPGERERQTVGLAESYIAGRMTRRMFIQRLLALGFSTAAAGSILAACTSAATVAPTVATAAPSAAPTQGPTFTPAPSVPDVSGTVRFLMGPWTDKEEEIQGVITEAFKKIYPNVDVTLTLYNWDSSSVEVMNSARNGQHDVFQVTSDLVTKYSAMPDLFEDISDRVNDPAWAAEKAHFVTWDRIVEVNQPRLVAIPIEWNPVNGIFVNLDMLDAAGFSLDDIASNEDTFAEAARKMTKAPDVYGIYFSGTGKGIGDWYSKGCLSAGHQFLTSDLKAVDIDNADVLQATQWMGDLFKSAAPALGSYDYSTVQDAFAGQKLAMFALDISPAVGLSQRNLPFQWAMRPWPPGPNVENQGIAGAANMLIMATKSPNKEAAWEMMKFWLSGPELAYWCDNAGPFPARDDAIQYGYGTVMPQQSKDALPIYMRIFKGWQVFPEAFQVNTICNTEWDKALAGEISAEQFLKNAAKEVQTVVFGG